MVLIPRGVSAARIVIHNLFGAQAKDDAVIVSDRLADLDIRAVERAERDGAVHHELHIARAGCLLRRRRDLLADVRRGVDQLADGDTEVLNEDDLHEL